MKTQSKKDNDRLDKSFKKSIKRLLNINLFEKSLSEQYNTLIHYNLLPYVYRAFVHYCIFIFNLKSNMNTELRKKFILNKTIFRRKPGDFFNAFFIKFRSSGSFLLHKQIIIPLRDSKYKEWMKFFLIFSSSLIFFFKKAISCA